MVRRKPISISDRLGRFNRLIAPIVPDTLGTVSLQQDLIDKIDAYRAEVARQALSKYNAESFKPIIVEQPDVTFVAPIGNINEKVPKSKRTVINGSRTPVKSYTGKQREFVNDIYNSYYKNLIASGSNPVDAKRQARHLAQKSAYETGYGQSIYARHNYGGHEVPDGKGGVRKLTFTSMDDYTKADIKLLDRKWKPWRNAKNEDEFVTAITTDYGQGRYNAVNSKYRNTYKGMSKRMNSYLNMRCGGGVKRPKAWAGAGVVIGSAIGAVSNLFGSILNGDAQRKQWEEQKRIQEHKDAITRAENMTQALGLTQNAQKEYENRFRLPYAEGGRRRLRNGFRITDGGYAIPMGDDTFFLWGGKHEDINETGQTGIGLKVYSKGGSVKNNQVEVEGGEIVQEKPNEIRVFSDTLGLDGYSFADLVQMGYDKDELFKIQQSMNGDYGKRRVRNGGRLTRPVGRIKAKIGLREILRRGYNTVRDSFIGDIWRLANQDFVNTDGATGTFIGKDGKVHTVNIPGIQGGAPNVLPGRVGGFRPQNIERGVRTTRNIANAVRQSVQRSTPVNAATKTTKAAKVITAPKGDVATHARQQARGYSWLRNQPMSQGYGNTQYIGVSPDRVNPYTGQIPFYTFGDALRSYWKEGIAGAGIAGGLIYGGNKYFDNYVLNNDTDDNVSVSIPVRNNTNSTSVTTNGSGVRGNNNTYVYGQARGNNPAPYEAIQIGATAPKLNAINVSTPSIDAAFYTPSKSSKSTTSNPATSSSTPARSSSDRRRLRNRGNNSTSASKVPTSVSEVPTTEQLLSVIPQNAAISTPSYTNPTEQVLRDMQEAAKPKEAPVTTPVINSAEDYFNYYNNNLNYNQNTRGNNSTTIATGPTVDMSILPKPGQYNFAGVTPQTVGNIDTTPKLDLSILPKKGDYNISGVNTPQTVGDGLTITPDNNNSSINNNNNFQRYTTGDKIGLVADVIGSLGSALINYNAAGNIAEPPAPVRLMPGKLITNYNIAPRLAQVSMLRNRGLRDTDELVSSSARLNARNRVYTLTNLQADQLWGEKTNREIELMNADTMNQQYLSAQSVQNYNSWLDRANQLMNYRKEKEGEALQFGLSGLSDAVGNFLDQGRQNYADDQSMKYYAALLGDEGIKWLRRSGVNVRNGGRFRLRNM